MKRYLCPNELKELEKNGFFPMDKSVEVFYTFVRNKKQIESRYLKASFYLQLHDYKKLSIDNKINLKYLYFYQQQQPYLFNQFTYRF